MPVQTVIKNRRSTAATWTSTNPVLASGELGLETDTSLFKFGDGTTAWTGLSYSPSSRTTQIAKNDTGGSVTKGQVVYISGANGANALFSLADADSEATSSKTVGLLAQNLATNGIGAIVTEGLLSGLNTDGATAGDSVWLSGTAGGFVFGAPPAKPAHSVYLGVVTRVSATVGEILVKVQNGYELNELHDVNITTPADKSGLVYDSASGLWIDKEVILRYGYGTVYLGTSPTMLNPNLGSRSFEPPYPMVEEDFPVGTRLRFHPIKIASYYPDKFEDIFAEGTVTGWNAIDNLVIVNIDYKYSGSQTMVAWESGFRVFVVSNKDVTFANITDVNITSPTNGQSLTYDSASSKWINSAASATGETISSFLLMGA